MATYLGALVSVWAQEAQAGVSSHAWREQQSLPVARLTFNPTNVGPAPSHRLLPTGPELEGDTALQQSRI